VGFGEDVEEVSAYVACCARSVRIKMLSPGSFLHCEFDCKRQAYMKTFGGVLVLMMNSGFRARSSGESEEYNARRRRIQLRPILRVKFKKCFGIL
jgi:hypothetical protein